MRFCIVTPVYNGVDYIDETLASVLTQAGDFEIYYHVQDGVSKDATMERVRAWADLLHKGLLPVLCKGIHFTYASESDTGMYDAINKAFAAALPPGDDVVMGWVNADDRIAPGSFSTICNIRRQFPEITFLGGRVSLLDHTGSIIGVSLPLTYSQPCMAAGLYDGRALPFVMQEGTFWCSGLWHAIGGAIDTRFRLAGDWDLWRRLAAHAPFVSVDSVLGFHRRRPGQLSSAMDKYYNEVETRLGRPVPAPAASPAPAPAPAAAAAAPAAPPAEAEPPAPLSEMASEYDRVFEEYERLQTDPAKYRASAYAALVVRFNLNQKLWEKIDNFGLVVGSPEVVSGGAVRRTLTVVPIAGFNSPEGPFPEWSLPAGIRWMRDPTAEGEVFLPMPGRYEVVLRCRSWTDGQTVTLRANGLTIGRMRIASHGNDRETEIRAAGNFGAGRLVLGIEVEQPDPNQRRILMTGWYLEPVPERNPREVTPVQGGLAPMGALAGPLSTGIDWPRISIVVPTRNQGQFITDTLESILRQGYPNLELIVADGASTDQTPDILRRYARHITHLISERDSGQSNAINKGFRVASGEIVTWLNSDDLLAKGALHAVALAFRTTGADLVAGVCDVFDDSNVTTHRHLPCLRDGQPLPLADILDLENCWMRGKFFHQPEVFFSRAIWDKAGGEVDEALYYSMDFDLWARMAKVGARITIIGRTVAHYRMHAAQKTSTPDAYRPELMGHAAKLRVEAGLPALPEQRPARQRLRVVFFNDYGFKYGAGIAHRRMAEALALAGQDVVALAYADFDKGAAEPTLSVEAVAAAILDEKPDLVILGNLHAIRADFDLLGTLLAGKVPVVFYAHDQWLVTGRCGYPSDCERYLGGCGADCPTAGAFPALPPQEIAPAYARKRALLANAAAAGARFAVFTNSHYMKRYLLEALPAAARPPTEVVYFGIDTRTFTHGRRWEARRLLDLPTDRFIIMTAATNVADRRKGLGLLLRALQAMPNPEQVLLLMMGFGSDLPDLPCEVRFSGYLDREDTIALHYQAADIFVGPSLNEALGQTYIEAGACGTPTVAFKVDGVVDAVLDGVTGLLMEETTADALLAGIHRLREDLVLRRQLAMQAVLHVRNRFSVEASAGQLLAALTQEPALGLDLVPNVVIAARPTPAIPLRYLTGLGAGVSKAAELPDWLPLAGITSESGLGSGGALPERFWWACGPASRFALKAATPGEYRLRIRCRCHIPEQALEFRANLGKETVAVRVPSHRFDFVQDLEVDLPLIAGLNRIDVGFAAWQQEDGGPRRLALLIEDIEALPASLGLVGAPDDGTAELLDGFSYAEGPYPEHGLPSEFRWTTGNRTRMRLFSANAGRRVVEVRLRNIHPQQQVTLYLGDKPVLSRTIADASIAVLHRLRFEASFAVGYQAVHIEVSQCLEAKPGERALAFAYEGVTFFPAGELEPAPEADAIRWDLSEGVGGEEGPYEPAGLMSPFRWLISRRPVLVLDRMAEAEVALRMRFRAPMPGQRALLSVNDGEAIALDFHSEGFGTPGLVQRNLLLRRGRNRLTFQFAEAAQPPGDPRDLVLLLEELALVEPSEAAPVAPPPAIAATPPPPAAAHDPDEPADGTVEYQDGISFAEGPYAEHGLPNRFRWCLGEASRLRLYSRIAGRRTLRLALRNHHANQVVRVLRDGAELGSFELDHDFTRPQECRLEVSLGAGWQELVLRPAMWQADPGAERLLSILLEAAELEAREVEAELPGEAADGAWRAVSGMRDEEGPYPELGLPHRFRWCLGDASTLDVFARREGRVQIVLTLRNFHPGQVVTVADGVGREVAQLALGSADMREANRCAVTLPVGRGWNRITLRPSRWSVGPNDEAPFAVILEELAMEREAV